MPRIGEVSVGAVALVNDVACHGAHDGFDPVIDDVIDRAYASLALDHRVVSGVVKLFKFVTGEHHGIFFHRSAILDKDMQHDDLAGEPEDDLDSVEEIASDVQA